MAHGKYDMFLLYIEEFFQKRFRVCFTSIIFFEFFYFIEFMIMEKLCWVRKYRQKHFVRWFWAHFIFCVNHIKFILHSINAISLAINKTISKIKSTEELPHYMNGERTLVRFFCSFFISFIDVETNFDKTYFECGWKW